jgi:hypothetical protein
MVEETKMNEALFLKFKIINNNGRKIKYYKIDKNYRNFLSRVEDAHYINLR